jgi:hypothetical protein
MRSGLNGECQPRNSHLARKALSSANPQSRKFARVHMEWTGDLLPLVHSMVNLPITTDDALLTPHQLARYLRDAL